MSERKNKSNKQFMILSAIAIFFVVDAHALSPFYVMANIMPYNSFFMPLFAFISGYFFNPEKLCHLPGYLWSRTKKLFIPFFAWNLFYGCIINLLRYWGIIYYGQPLNFHHLFIEPFLGCFSYEINSPSWYIPTIFMVIVIYAVIRKLLGRIWNEWLVTFLTFSFGIYSVYLARHGYNSNPLYLAIMKMGFLLPFYQSGYFYKVCLEKYCRKIPRLLLLFLPVAIDSILLYLTHDLNFISLATMSGFLNDYYAIPMITSVCGICFWLTVSDIMVPVWSDNRLINYISNNTFTIMMHHILFFNVYNLLLAVLTRFSVIHIPFDFEGFRSTAWYRYEPLWQCNVWYVFFGLTGPLALKYLYDNTRKKLKNKLSKHK